MYSFTNLVTPSNYVCTKCGAKGVKLWRDYNTFLEHLDLYCVSCACKKGKVSVKTVREDGKYQSDFGWCDQVGGLVPAVPTVELDTYWGYTSVPQVGCEWWRALPLRLKKKVRA